MKSAGIWLFMFSLFCSCCLATGLTNPASAAEDQEKATAKPVEGEIQFEGRGEGYVPEPAKEECPATFGLILTDTAIPTEKGRFVIQPTFGLSFTTNNFSPSWRRISAAEIFNPLA